MRAPQILTDFFEWRWAPCVALIAGSLAYVGFALLFIPNQFDLGASSSSSAASMVSAPAMPSTAFASALTQNAINEAPSHPERARRAAAPLPRATEEPIRRGFSPPIERPEAPPSPPPAPATPAPTETAPAVTQSPTPAPEPSATAQTPLPTPAQESPQQQQTQ